MENLVYNTCWEDPRCDRNLMDFDAKSKVVMITSAGCNALDYLLDDPSEIHCVDMNPRQNALMHLKMAAIRSKHPDDVFQLFGEGHHPQAKEWYRDSMRTYIPGYAADFWDKKIKIFSGRGMRKTFYHRSTSGTLAWLIMNFVRTRPSLARAVESLLECKTLSEQQQVYPGVEKKLFGPFITWLMNRNLTLYLAGVPVSQKNLMKDGERGGVIGYIRTSLQNVFMQLPIQENYFWRVYIKGAYSKTCCPNYLKAENQPILAAKTDRIQTYNATLSDFLKANPGKYSHFILLDHQDWLSRNNMAALAEEWQLILQNSEPGAKVLMRSAAPAIDFIPKFVHDRVQFQKERTQKEALLDRVGTYASVEMGVIQ